MSKDENLTDKPSWGGTREGSGRKKGQLNEATKERAKVLQAYRDRVSKNADRIFNAQLDLAVGEKYLMVKRVQGEGKNRKTWVEVVDDIETIKSYIDDDGVTLNEDAGEDYYYMTTKPANNQALDSLLDRTFGKAEAKLDVTSDGEKIGDAAPSDELRADFAEFLKNRK